MGRDENLEFTFFDDLLSIKIGEIGNQDLKRRLAKSKLSIFELPVGQDQLHRLTRSLHENLYNCLRTVYDPIPRDTITGMRENYCEQLPKTMRFKSAPLTRTSRAGRVADLLGITKLLSSERLRTLGENATGKRAVRQAPRPA
jgi:hypothetical protein